MESGVGSLVLLVGQNAKFLVVKYYDGLLYYVKKGNLCVTTRNYDAKVLRIYDSPEQESKYKDVSDLVMSVPIYGFCNNWFYVKVKDKRGRSHYGWLPPEMQNGNPYTTEP